MLDQNLRLEAIRLLIEIDDDRLEDLVACLRSFREQQDFEPVDFDTEEMSRRLQEALEQAQRGELIPHSQVVEEINELLSNLKAREKQ